MLNTVTNTLNGYITLSKNLGIETGMASEAVQQDAGYLNGTNTEAIDVCIVGAGPAGLMLA